MFQIHRDLELIVSHRGKPLDYRKIWRVGQCKRGKEEEKERETKKERQSERKEEEKEKEERRGNLVESKREIIF